MRSLLKTFSCLTLILSLGMTTTHAQVVNTLSYPTDSVPTKTKIDTLAHGESIPGYHDIEVTGGANSVDADLKSDAINKKTWVDNPYDDHLFKYYYLLKKNLKKKAGIAIGTDYMFLNQYASFSYSDIQASSGIFRLFSTWQAFETKKLKGSFVFKIENRHLIGKGLTPRNLGYEAGSALSTASFKEFNWGLTNFYWKQLFGSDVYGNGKVALVFGIMDAGDWIDLFPQLNPFKYYLNEAFFNSPAMALPNQGLGVSGVVHLRPNIYVSGGMHDANGEPTYFLKNNFESFFNDKEFFTWVELGYNSTRTLLDGETVHLTYWHQDERTEVGTEESYGWCFSAAKKFSNGLTPFLRADISKGNGALMHHMIMTGFTKKIVRSDVVGLGLNYGGPNDRSKRDQYGIEAFYSVQLTQRLNITPDIQLTINPSFNESKDVVGVYSVCRLRYAL